MKVTRGVVYTYGVVRTVAGRVVVLGVVYGVGGKVFNVGGCVG